MEPRPTPSSSAPFVIVGLIAVVPLLFLSAAAPGGGAWKWLEDPRSVTVIACVLGVITLALALVATAVGVVFTLTAWRRSPR